MKPTTGRPDENRFGGLDRPTSHEFLRSSAVVAAATLGFPYVGRVLGANDKINVACIGVGGKGDSDTDDSVRCGGNLVALCDVDENPLRGKAQKYPQARLYRDFRKLLEEMDKSIDAATVSTPDHCHGVASVMAMKMGKHIYCQKPLTQTFMKRASCGNGRSRRSSPRRWATRAVRTAACVAPWRWFRPASSVKCANCMSGPTARFGPKG
jgi:hypothetical protein